MPECFGTGYWLFIFEMGRKKIFWLSMVILLVFPGTFLRAGVRDFIISIRNVTQTASNRLEFDLYIVDTDPDQDFQYATSQIGLLLNSGIYEGGDIDVAIDNRDSKILPLFIAKPRISSSPDRAQGKTHIELDGVNVLAFGNGMALEKVEPGTLMTRFIISSTVDFTINTSPDIEFTGSLEAYRLFPTRVAAYINRLRTYIPVVPGENAIVYENPVLNQVRPPEPFEVTGTGSFCENEEGLPVGLAGSQREVMYYLYRDGVLLDIRLEGTGSEISFGIQKAGVYTVTGVNMGGETGMTGNATITENPVPEEPAVSVDCSLGAGGAVISIINPADRSYEYRLDDGEFQQDPVFRNVLNGSHTVTVKNESGCTVTGSPFTVDCPCADPPVIVLSSYSGSTCGTAAVTVSDNRFGGSATGVSLHAGGDGRIFLVSASSNRFEFIYLPAESDIGKTISITVETNNPAGPPCEAATAVYMLTVSGIPPAPVPGEVSVPTCTVPAGSVVLSGLPALGNWTVTRYPGSHSTTGNGTQVVLGGIPPGEYLFTVTNSAGCTSPLSDEVIIPDIPDLPSAPVPGEISHPTPDISTGSVVITGLPSRGVWHLTRSPGDVVISGTGTTTLVSSLLPGSYTFTVTNEEGCISPPSPPVVINPRPDAPVLVINNPPTICSTETTDLTRPEITEGSEPGLILTYWRDDRAQVPLNTPASAPAGTYYIRAANAEGFYVIKPVIVLADEMPVADSGPDMTLGYVFETRLDARIPAYGNGMWEVLEGDGRVDDIYDPRSTVRELSMGQNILLWKVKNGVCPEAADSLTINVRDFLVPSLLTPNMDGRNDNFTIVGLERLGRTELVVFDRRGARVYHNNDYSNDWNGVDYYGRLLPDDTYFYILKTENGQTISGFIVLRK